MLTSTLTKKGQVTIPKKIRDILGLREHDKINFIKRNGEVFIKPLKGDILELRGSVKPKKKPEDFEEVRRIVKKIIADKAVKE